jgi:hypothetical protein
MLVAQIEVHVSRSYRALGSLIGRPRAFLPRQPSPITLVQVALAIAMRRFSEAKREFGRRSTIELAYAIWPQPVFQPSDLYVWGPLAASPCKATSAFLWAGIGTAKPHYRGMVKHSPMSASPSGHSQKNRGMAQSRTCVARQFQARDRAEGMLIADRHFPEHGAMKLHSGACDEAKAFSVRTKSLKASFESIKECTARAGSASPLSQT